MMTRLPSIVVAFISVTLLQTLAQTTRQPTKTESELTAKAMRGDTDAMYDLAMAYAVGDKDLSEEGAIRGIKMDTISEFVWLTIFTCFVDHSPRGIGKLAAWTFNAMSRQEAEQAIAKLRALGPEVESRSGKEPCMREWQQPVEYWLDPE